MESLYEGGTIYIMNTRLAITAVLVLVIAGFAVYTLTKPTEEPQANAVATTTPTTTNQNIIYTSAKYGISFAYPSSYELSERDNEGSALREHYTIILMRKEDLPAPEGGEGPPAITIDMHQNNLDSQTTENWIRNSSLSNFKLGEGMLSSTTISGLPALSFRWSGLYEGTTIALSQPNWIYAFSVTYMEPGADIVQDFVAVRDSIRISASQTP